MKKTEFFIGRNYECSSVGSEVKVYSSYGKEYMEVIVQSILEENSIDGYSAYWIKGMWKGNAEDTYCVIIFHDYTDEYMEDIAKQFKYGFKQESVLLTTQELQVSFI